MNDRPDEEIIKDIKSVLDNNIKNAVAMHNGMINFLSLNNCSGILNALKRKV